MSGASLPGSAARWAASGWPGFITANFSAASRAVRGVSSTYRPNVMCGATASASRSRLIWSLASAFIG